MLEMGLPLLLPPPERAQRNVSRIPELVEVDQQDQLTDSERNPFVDHAAQVAFGNVLKDIDRDQRVETIIHIVRNSGERSRTQDIADFRKRNGSNI